MPPESLLVSRLQALDLRIAELEKEISALPKHVAVIEKTLESHLRRLEADRAALSANHKDRKRLEGEIQLHEQKISKLRDQMLGAKTNEQYRAFQHEIEYIAKEIRAAEDRILELMSEAEPLEINVKKAEVALAEENKSVDAEKKTAQARTAADQTQLTQCRAERAEAVQAITPSTLSIYERIRKKWNGVAIAEATTGRCAACQIVLRPQVFQDLKRGDQFMTCESCGRFLYYNPPVSVEDAVKAG